MLKFISFKLCLELWIKIRKRENEIMGYRLSLGQDQVVLHKYFFQQNQEQTLTWAFPAAYLEETFIVRAKKKDLLCAACFFKSTLRLWNVGIIMGSALVRSSTTDLFHWHSAMSVDILAYLCFRRILSWYRRFRKWLKTKPKNSGELIPFTPPFWAPSLQPHHRRTVSAQRGFSSWRT